jgi:hypothetical protein
LALTHGVIDFPDKYTLKTLKIFFLKKTQRARALIFSMKHLQVSVYQVCLNKSPWSKLAQPQGPLIENCCFPLAIATSNVFIHALFQIQI